MEIKSIITVTLVEDDASFRERIQMLLSQDERFAVIASVDNYTEALKELVENPPDVILMDIQLTTEKSGIDLVWALREKKIESKIVMLTSFDDDDNVFNALRSGANGYLIKGESLQIICNGIAEAFDGKAPMSARIASLLITYFNELGSTNKELRQLTKRENEILEKLAQGFLYKEVADQLDISPETVKKHAGSIYRKLHVSNKTEAINIFNKK